MKKHLTNPPSEALKRVYDFKILNNGESRLDGFFMSLSQLEALTEKLRNGDVGKQAKGFAFMIGQYSIEHQKQFTVEVIPYTVKDGNRDFFNNDLPSGSTTIGNLDIKLGVAKDIDPNETEGRGHTFFIRNHLRLPRHSNADGDGTSQKTPSPPALTPPTLP